MNISRKGNVCPKEKPAGICGALRQIWDYYKLPLAVGAILVYIVCYALFRQAGHREVLLYTAFVNVAPGETLMEQLSDGFTRSMDIDTSKEEFRFLTGWYLTTNPDSELFQYVQASQMKILASIDAQQLDVVLMDREAFDAFAQNGYLYDLDEFREKMADGEWKTGAVRDPARTCEILDRYKVENMEILEDNAKEVALDPDVSYQSKTRTCPMAVDLSESSRIGQAGFSDTVYLGILANTPRPEMAAAYLEYMFS